MAQNTAHPTPAQAVELLIRTLGLHSKLSMRDERAIRALRAQVRTVRRGEDIVRQGDRPNVAVMVISGMLARYHTTQDGERQYLSLHLAGDLPDLQSLFLGKMDHSLCALDQALIAVFRHAEILTLLKRSPSTTIAFWRHTLIDAAIFRQGITRNSTRSAVARIANLFCEQFTRARIVGVATGWSCPFPLSQTQIGQVVGLSIATVNRAAQSLRAEDRAQVRAGRLHILNWRRLCQVCAFEPVYLHGDLRGEGS
jgi:CRP-like cAMP-binding protein